MTKYKTVPLIETDRYKFLDSLICLSSISVSFNDL